MITPKFSLDFTTGVLDSKITFSRTTSATNPATYVDSNGYVVSATDNQARFDYNPATLACLGLLIEESRSNVLKYSSDFSNPAYIAGKSSITTNATTAPDNTNTAQKLVEDSTSGIHQVYQNYALAAAATVTHSVYAKAGERTVIVMLSGGVTRTFNLSTGTTSGSGASIKNAGNGWYRCVFTGAIPDNANRSYGVNLSNGTTTNYTGDGSSGAYIWGMQLEVGAFVTSYIPTTSASLTRNADVATITGTNFSSWWVASQGGVTANFRPSTVSGTRPIIQYDDGTANEIITLRGNTTNPELYIVDGGAPQAQIDAGTIAANTDYSLTGWWQTNDCRAKLGSGAQVIDNTATIPTVTQARIGSDGTNYLNGTIASISYYDSFTSQIYNRRKNKAIFSLM